MTFSCVFPGQGSQSVGMGKALAEAFPRARRVFEEVDDTLCEKLSTLIWEGSTDTLTLTANAQPALMTVSIAVVRVLEDEAGLDISKAAYVAGHSLGEYSALVAAGSLTLPDAARLLRVRGNAMQEASPAGEGAMAALIGLEPDQVDKIVLEAAEGQVCASANDNGGGQIVISGHTQAVDRAILLAQKSGVKRAIKLPVSAPFHCALMQPAADVMAKALEKVEIVAPKAPLVANVHAQAVTDPEIIRQGLIDQVVGTVRWRESIQYIYEHGIERFYELGAGKVLAGLIKRIVSPVQTMSISAPEDVTLFETL